ncbi:hypothetical protein CC86DRAFT_365806 [Ophiobolus disseminans]|uniref:Uncharacterized protein n=1 Tax=Ophiobolus disseminans TaxID=1469910 RepID=A0A6A7AF84_9PLEO|nr:hypothetical protein CC86DRAFT_365806 [Ophiobolus disseminans]
MSPELGTEANTTNEMQPSPLQANRDHPVQEPKQLCWPDIDDYGVPAHSDAHLLRQARRGADRAGKQMEGQLRQVNGNRMTRDFYETSYKSASAAYMSNFSLHRHNRRQQNAAQAGQVQPVQQPLPTFSVALVKPSAEEIAWMQERAGKDAEAHVRLSVANNKKKKQHQEQAYYNEMYEEKKATNFQQAMSAWVSRQRPQKQLPVAGPGFNHAQGSSATSQQFPTPGFAQGKRPRQDDDEGRDAETAKRHEPDVGQQLSITQGDVSPDVLHPQRLSPPAPIPGTAASHILPPNPAASGSPAQVPAPQSKGNIIQPNAQQTKEMRDRANEESEAYVQRVYELHKQLDELQPSTFYRNERERSYKTLLYQQLKEWVIERRP